MLPAPLLEHAEIGEMAAFVGRGPRFQIWQPKAREAFAASVRERVLRENPTLRVRPPKGPPGGPGGESGGGEP